VGVDVECYILEDGRYVISASGEAKALASLGNAEESRGRKRGDLKTYLERLPKEVAHLAAAASIQFLTTRGDVAHGREAQQFIDDCAAYSEALERGLLHPKQEHIAAIRWAAPCNPASRGQSRGLRSTPANWRPGDAPMPRPLHASAYRCA
jgi:hypothetical protein